MKTLQELTKYYNQNQLKLNLRKTQICSFHLKIWHAKKGFKIAWLREQLLRLKIRNKITFTVHYYYKQILP